MGQFLTQVDGFTPVIDALAKELGLIPAAVYGVVWRYCQMRDGVCRAGLEALGAALGLHPATVLRHLKALCRAGYLEDLTPHLRNKPHIYRDTGRLKIIGLVEGGHEPSAAPLGEPPRPAPQGPAESRAAQGPTLQGATSPCPAQCHVAESALKRPGRNHQETTPPHAAHGEAQGRGAPPPRRGSKQDPRTKHAAIRCVHGLTGKNPPKALYDELIAVLGEAPNEALAARCYREWVKRGYNPQAFTWALEWYAHGGPPNGGTAHPREAPEPAGFAGLRAFLEEEDSRRGHT